MTAPRMRLAVLIVMIMLYMETGAAPISVDFSGFDAVFSQNQRLKISFRCTGGSGVYQFGFKNIPSDWKTVDNSIII